MSSDTTPQPRVKMHPTRTDDQSYLDSFRQAAFAPVFASFRSILDVAEATDKVAGFVSIQLNHEMHVGEIRLTTVHPTHAGHDIGTAMYAFAQYQDRAKLLLMVSWIFSLHHTGSTMKNNIDDAD